MDLIKQNKFIGWVIAILVTLNVMTVAMVWTLSSNQRHGSAQPARISPPSDPIRLMQREISLTDEQAQNYEQLREKHMGDMRAINDKLDALKLQMADEVFNPNLDEKQIKTLAEKIGLLQTELEKLRFDHFRELVLICSEEQKAKLQPILRQVFGKKGSNDRSEERPEPRRREHAQQEEKEERLARPQERPGSANREERIHRLQQRLALSQKQAKMVELLMDSTRLKEENYKSTHRSDRNEFDKQKEIFRQQENDRIMEILNPQQRQEFLKMQQKQRK